eukprot:2372797-Amphidinium_carterae.1
MMFPSCNKHVHVAQQHGHDDMHRQLWHRLAVPLTMPASWSWISDRRSPHPSNRKCRTVVVLPPCLCALLLNQDSLSWTCEHLANVAIEQRTAKAGPSLYKTCLTC